MRTLPRYVLAELTKVFSISLAALTLMMIIVGVVREASMQSLPLAQVVQLLPYILPDALRIAAPVTLLLATTFVYGRMSGCNEVVAAKALGISPMALLWPAYIAAFLLSLVTVWLNDVAVSWGRAGVQRVVIESVEEIVYAVLRTQRSYNSSDFTISVKRVEGRRLIRPIVSYKPRNGSRTINVRAEAAELRSDHAGEVLQVILDKPMADADGSFRFYGGDEFPLEIPLRDASRAKRVEALPSWLSLRVMPEEKIRQEQLISRQAGQHAAEAAYQMLCGDFEDLTSAQWEARAESRRLTRGRMHRLKLEPHRRWSAGFSCLCFVWVGAPMAIWLRKSDFLAVFFVCFLPILVVYYPLLIYGIDGAKNGTIPAYSIWTGNVLLVFCGALLLRKVMRY